MTILAYYLQQCPGDEQIINECLRDSGNKLVHYLRQGIPELEIYEVRMAYLKITTIYFVINKCCCLSYYCFLRINSLNTSNLD